MTDNIPGDDGTRVYRDATADTVRELTADDLTQLRSHHGASYARTDHQLTTTTARHGEFIDNIAGCTCGVTFGWYGRGTEHEHHVDEQIVARFTGR